MGTVSALSGDTLHSHSKEIDGLMAEIHCLYNQAELILGGSEDDFARHDPAGPASFLSLRRQFLLANQDRPYGYDVLDGFAIHSHHVSVYPVPPQTQVVLASDGYPVLKGTWLKARSPWMSCCRKTLSASGKTEEQKGL